MLSILLRNVDYFSMIIDSYKETNTTGNSVFGYCHFMTSVVTILCQLKKDFEFKIYDKYYRYFKNCFAQL